MFTGLVGSNCFWSSYLNDWDFYNNPYEYNFGVSGIHSIYTNDIKGVRKWKFRFCKVNLKRHATPFHFHNKFLLDNHQCQKNRWIHGFFTNDNTMDFQVPNGSIILGLKQEKMTLKK